MADNQEFNHMAKLTMGEDAVTHQAVNRLLIDAQASISSYSAKGTIDASKDDVQIHSAVNGKELETISGRSTSSTHFELFALNTVADMDMTYFAQNGAKLGSAKLDVQQRLYDPSSGTSEVSYSDANGHPMMFGRGQSQLTEGAFQNNGFTIENVTDASGHARTLIETTSMSKDSRDTANNVYLLKDGVSANRDSALNLNADDVVGVVHSVVHENGDQATVDVQIQGPSKPAIPLLER